jgi:hypothetical protein
MKRNLLILALLVAAFCLTVPAQAAWIQDEGAPDTLRAEVWETDYYIGETGPYLVRVPLYVSHDLVTAVDSLAGFTIPLCYTTSATGTVNYCSVSTWWNQTTCTATSSKMPRSIFRHMPDMVTATVLNRMLTMQADESERNWDFVTLDLDGTSHYWFTTVPTGDADQRWWEGNRVLLVTMTFNVDMAYDAELEICIDSCFWPPSSNLSYANDAGELFTPQIWDDYLGEESYCFTMERAPDPFPVPDCPDDQDHSTSGTFTVPVSATDNGTVEAASVSFTGDITGVSLSGSGLGSAEYNGTIEYTVDHCLGGGTITFTVADDLDQEAFCTFNVTTSNDAPVITCPANTSVPYNLGLHKTATATDANGDAMTFSGDYTASNGSINWATDCGDVGGPYTINVSVEDACGATDECSFQVTVTNAAPTIACPDDGEAVENQLWTSDPFEVTDAEGAATCDDVAITDVSPAVLVSPYIDGCTVRWAPDATVPDGFYTITLEVTDPCEGKTDDCSFVVKKTSTAPGMVWIGEPAYNSDCANPGDFISVPIEIMAPTVPGYDNVGGFEFEVTYDFASLTLMGVHFDDELAVGLGWEKLTYRTIPCDSIYSTLDDMWHYTYYKIIIYGQADMPNGSAIGECMLNGETYTVVWLDFYICNNQLLRGYCLPISFDWDEYSCSENTMSDCSGNLLFVSEDDQEYDPEECSHLDQYPPAPVLQFFDGCIYICLEDEIKCDRGDINLNHIAYEVADAVLFASYFITNDVDDVFILDPQEGQICATDINADGWVLTLPDLVMLIQVILRDVPAIPKVAPSTEVASMIISGGTIKAECTDPLAAMVFVFDGTISATLLADNMEMMVGDSRVLVWSRTGQTVQNAEVLSFTGAQLVSVQAVDNQARELQTAIYAKTTPSSFALHAAYPNPFNPYVNLSFDMPSAATYSLRIYNVAGQLVRSYDGTATVGSNVIQWDGKDNSGSEVSSGVYFYKLTSAGISATEKMVMMK